MLQFTNDESTPLYSVQPLTVSNKCNVSDNDVITYPVYQKSTSLGDSYCGEAKGLDREMMDRQNWLLHLSRVRRADYDQEQIENIVNNTAEPGVWVACALYWLEITEDVPHIWQMAANYALKNKLAQLQYFLPNTTEWDEYVAVAVAIAHYELMRNLPAPAYYENVEIQVVQGEYWRVYGKPMNLKV